MTDHTFPIKLTDKQLLAKCEQLLLELDAAWQPWIAKHASGVFDPMTLFYYVELAIGSSALAACEEVRWLEDRVTERGIHPFDLFELMGEEVTDQYITGQVTIKDDQVATLWKLTFGGSI